LQSLVSHEKQKRISEDDGRACGTRQKAITKALSDKEGWNCKNQTTDQPGDKGEKRKYQTRYNVKVVNSKKNANRKPSSITNNRRREQATQG